MIQQKEKKAYGLFGAACLTLFIILIIDILTKYFVVQKLDLEGSKFVVISKLLSFQFTINENAAFGNNFFLDKFLEPEEIRMAFIIFISVCSVAFIAIFIAARKSRFLFKLSLAMIIAGSLGNLYDRLVYDGVRDFIRVEYFGKELFGSDYFPIFNVADSSLVIGIFLFAVYLIFMHGSDKSKGKKASDKNVGELEAAKAE